MRRCSKPARQHLAPLAALVLVCSASLIHAESLEDCALLDNDIARLACFDERVPGTPRETSIQSSIETSIDASQEAPTPVPTPAPIVEAEQVAAEPVAPEPSETAPSTQRRSGWLPWRRQGRDSGGGLFGDEPLELDALVRHVRMRDKQRMVFLLDNEQIWMQTKPRNLPIREGDRVTVRNATMGGYYMSTGSGVSTRVRRIQ